MYKIDILLKQQQQLFHTNDLALLWQVDNPNTLYTTIKRYVQRGILIKIHKGFYSTIPLEKIDPVRLGMGYLHGFAYLSTESVLTTAGIMFQSSSYITLVAAVSRKFTIGGDDYLVRQMKGKFLYQTVGIEEKEGIRLATVERAVADLLYFHPSYHFDNRGGIDWQRVRQIQQEVGFK